MSAHPWQLSEREWNAEREALRPDFVQSMVTRHSASEAVRDMKRLEWLLFGVTHSATARLNAAARGEIVLSGEELAECVERVETPVYYSDVIAKARAEGLLT